MERGENVVLLFRADDFRLSVGAGNETHVEPRFEGSQVVENLRQKKIQQRPQLGQVVLEEKLGGRK